MYALYLFYELLYLKKRLTLYDLLFPLRKYVLSFNRVKVNGKLYPSKRDLKCLENTKKNNKLRLLYCVELMDRVLFFTSCRLLVQGEKNIGTFKLKLPN